jgi:hypothetical protein
MITQKNIDQWVSVISFKLKIPKEDAQDYVQEAICLHFEKNATNKNKHNLGYVWGTVWNTAIKYRGRKIGKNKHIEDIGEESFEKLEQQYFVDYEQIIEEESIVHCSRELLKYCEYLVETSLGPTHAQIFRIMLYTNMKTKEVAELTGISKSYISRSYTMSKNLLKDTIKMNELKELAERFELGRAF